MRAQRLLLLSTGACLLVACGDLFHTTTWETACDADASACPPSNAGGDATVDAGAAFPADFCAWDHATARANAAHACAWLGACAGPLGSNAFGACIKEAILAYDCAANPNRPVVGAAHTFWDQLWRVSSCSQVTALVEPTSPRATCGSSTFAYVACEVGGNAATRLACMAGGGGADQGRENCAAWGQACTVIGSTAACTGSLGSQCSGDDAGPSCSGTQLHDCDPDSGIDQGVDCANFGAGSCAAAGACAAVGDGGCAATSVVTCAGDVASGCPSGAPETLDCSQILGVTSSCNGAGVGRPWDVSRACSAGSGTCAPDSCSGTVLQSCVQGAPVSVDCATLGFSACTLVSFASDPSPHAACVPH